MKRVNSILLAIILLIMAGCGVSKAKSNNEVEQWIASNLTEIRQLREHFKSTIHTGQQEKRAEFTPFQTQALFAGKLLEVLELNWTEQEREYLQSLLEFIVLNPVLFSDERDSEEFLELAEKAESFENYAEEELGWDFELRYAVAHTLAPMNENKDIDPKFKQLCYSEIDGKYVPHMQVDGERIPIKIIDGDYFPLEVE